jgi:hypothetical protein
LGGVDDAFLDLIRENLPGLDVLYVNECAGITNVEELLFFVYELGLDAIQVFDIPVVDGDVESALYQIHCDSLMVNSGPKD